MKSMKNLLLTGVAIALAFTSCTMEKRVYTSGYHIEWNKGKNAPAVQTAKNEVKDVEKAEAIPATETISTENTTDNATIQVPAQTPAFTASTDNSPSATVVNRTVTAPAAAAVSAAKPISKSEVRAMVKQGMKKAKAMNANKAGGDKSYTMTLVLCIFVGLLGIHRFYLGYTWQGIVQLLTLGGCGVWSLIDLIRIIMKDLEPKNGSYDK